MFQHVTDADAGNGDQFSRQCDGTIFLVKPSVLRQRAKIISTLQLGKSKFICEKKFKIRQSSTPLYLFIYLFYLEGLPVEPNANLATTQGGRSSTGKTSSQVASGGSRLTMGGQLPRGGGEYGV